MYNKLIIFIGTLQSGGSERVVSEISAMYADHFQEVIVLTYYDAKVFYKLDPRVRLECVEMHTSSRNIIKNALWIRHFVKKEHPTTFVSFMLPFNVLSIWVLMFLRIPIAVCERSDPENVGNRFLRLLRNITYHFCDKIQVQTNAGKSYFSSCLQKKILVIPNPNHITLAERDWALGHVKENRIVTVGRLIPEKNHEMLIEAFAMISKENPQYILDIYGEGNLRSVLQNKIGTLGLEHKVFLHGNVNDVPCHIASAKMFVLSSDIEGMPNALIEAMALGLPCVATDVSGVRDIIEDGMNGYIVPCNNKKLLAYKMNVLLKNPDMMGQFSDNTKVVFEKFDSDKISCLWLDLVK